MWIAFLILWAILLTTSLCLQVFRNYGLPVHIPSILISNQSLLTNGNTWTSISEDLWKALDCYDPIDEEVLVKVCVPAMFDEYHVENLSFSSFSRLMEAAKERMSLWRRLRNQVIHVVPILW